MFNLLGDPALRLRTTPQQSSLVWAVTSVTFTSTQGCLLTLSATPPGQNYTLLATTNLLVPVAAWAVVSTGTVPVGPFVMADPAATNFPQRFYRLSSP